MRDRGTLSPPGQEGIVADPTPLLKNGEAASELRRRVSRVRHSREKQLDSSLVRGKGSQWP